MDQLANIETQVKALWEKAQRAGELIARLREERQALESENGQLQKELAKLRLEVSARELQIQKLTTASAAADSKPTGIFSNGESEHLTAQVKELLARIDAYL